MQHHQIISAHSSKNTRKEIPKPDCGSQELFHRWCCFSWASKNELQAFRMNKRRMEVEDVLSRGNSMYSNSRKCERIYERELGIATAWNERDSSKRWGWVGGTQTETQKQSIWFRNNNNNEKNLLKNVHALPCKTCVLFHPDAMTCKRHS